MVCKTEHGGDCRAVGVTYEIQCNTEEGCEHIYIGNTARNGYIRGEEHQNMLRNKSEKSVLWKHRQEKHPNKEPEYKMKIIDKCRNNPLQRQLYEAVRIRRAETSKIYVIKNA